MVLRELALFAGAGGGILGGQLLGWRTVCAVELDPYCRSVLLARQLEGHLDRFPIWDDVRTFDGRPWSRGGRKIDVITAGWPCQDVSCAGKGEGLDGKRSGLWVEVARILGEVRPRYFLGENSPMLLANRGWRAVFGDLSALGYRYRWGVIGAHHAGAPHKRDRIWILATHADREHIRHDEQRDSRRRDELQDGGNSEPVHDGASWAVADADRHGRRDAVEVSRAPNADRGDVLTRGQAGDLADADRGGRQELRQQEHSREQSARRGEPDRCREGGRWTWPGGGLPWPVEPDVGRVLSDGVAHRVDRLRAIGNGQVPRVAALAWCLLGGP